MKEVGGWTGPCATTSEGLQDKNFEQANKAGKRASVDNLLCVVSSCNWEPAIGTTHVHQWQTCLWLLVCRALNMPADMSNVRACIPIGHLQHLRGVPTFHTSFIHLTLHLSKWYLLGVANHLFGCWFLWFPPSTPTLFSHFLLSHPRRLLLLLSSSSFKRAMQDI